MKVVEENGLMNEMKSALNALERTNILLVDRIIEIDACGKLTNHNKRNNNKLMRILTKIKGINYRYRTTLIRRSEVLASTSKIWIQAFIYHHLRRNRK